MFLFCSIKSFPQGSRGERSRAWRWPSGARPGGASRSPRAGPTPGEDPPAVDGAWPSPPALARGGRSAGADSLSCHGPCPSRAFRTWRAGRGLPSDSRGFGTRCLPGRDARRQPPCVCTEQGAGAVLRPPKHGTGRRLDLVMLVLSWPARLACCRSPTDKSLGRWRWGAGLGHLVAASCSSRRRQPRALGDRAGAWPLSGDRIQYLWDLYEGGTRV